ncbi:MAG TPA: helix-hairpin-helix domain-containing protein [Opitutaceae bacterium]|nr:helix-hairpin-helix domain-containing protein [Opitutaceae bacterium]
MWICLGLVALALYFANSMNSELHAADNRTNEIAARQAIAGGMRYAAYVLKQYAVGGVVPDVDSYKAEALPVGDASFWFIGRNNDDPQQTQATEPYFALVDEASKLNLNTATSAMIQALPLPGMTSDIADAIVAWRNNGQNAANYDNNYSQLNPPRHNKGGPFETIEELRLVYGVSLDILLGEDTNRNGVLDPNEDDGETSAPRDDQNGQLLAGLLEYVTVYSREPATSASGSRRINLSTPPTPQTRQQLVQRLTQRGITQQRALQIVLRAGANPFNSVAEFLLTTQMTADEFALVHTDLTATTAANGTTQGLININTASAAVLACIPGIGTDYAATIVAYRAAHPDSLTSMAWITEVLPPASIRQAGRYITDQSYQFSADIAAVGANGRGYAREKFVFDVSTATPRVVARQDLSAAGWALGTQTRTTIREPKNT